MVRPTIPEVTAGQSIINNWNRDFRSLSQEAGPLPAATFANKYVMMVAVAVDVNPTEAQMNAFETSIESIAGVFKALVMGEGRIPTDRTPSGYELFVRLEGQFVINPVV